MNIDCKGVEYEPIPIGHAKDITDMRFERLLAKYRVTPPIGRNQKESYWLCECDCGNKVVVRAIDLFRQHTKSCGCLCKEMLLNQITYNPGDIVNGFKFLGRDMTKKAPSRSYFWRVECPYCHKQYSISSETIRNGRIQSCGCLSISKGEAAIKKILDDFQILYKTQVTFPGFVSSRGGYLKYDFALYDEDGNIISIVEYDGAQHFIPKERFGGANDFAIVQENDRLKDDYCHVHNIPIIRIPYTCKTITLDMLLPQTSQFLI